MNLHNRQLLISGLAKALRDVKGFELRAIGLRDSPRKPWPVSGFMPDVIAYDPVDDLLQLGDVVTSKDLSSTEIEEKLMAHSCLVMTNGGSKGKRVPLHIAIAEDDGQALEKLLEQIEIEEQVTIWTTGQAIAC
jgi:hypothetical protein